MNGSGTSRPFRLTACPRCGYDLRGVVEAWKESCPLAGVCSECGLRIDWSEFFRTTKPEPAWSVEFSSVARWPLAAISTAVRSLIPWRFWSALSMMHRLRWKRLAAYAATVVASMYIIFALVHGGMSAAEVVSARSLYQGANVTMTTTPRKAFVVSAAQPWEWTSPGTYTITLGGGRTMTWVFDSPRQRLEVWAQSEAPVLLLMAALFLLLTPAAFAVLPVARRRAKVRWRHIGRITAYTPGLFLPLFAMFLIGEAAWLAHRGYSMPPEIGDWLTSPRAAWLVTGSLVVGGLLTAAWWTAAASRYLRMERPLLVGLSVTALGFFAAPALTYIVWSDGVTDLFYQWIRAMG